MPTREKRREGAAKSHTAVTRRANRGAARWQHCSSLNLHLLLHFSLNSVQQINQPQERKLFTICGLQLCSQAQALILTRFADFEF
jgi:hypothetical protein